MTTFNKKRKRHRRYLSIYNEPKKQSSMERFYGVDVHQAVMMSILANGHIDNVGRVLWRRFTRRATTSMTRTVLPPAPDITPIIPRTLLSSADIFV